MLPSGALKGGEEVHTPATPVAVEAERPSRIGKYDILAEIGNGTLVKLFRASDRDTGRRVVLKLLAQSQDHRLVELFRRMVATAARLHHRNLITIYELGDHNGQPFAAMQDLDGRELASAIKGQPPLTFLEKVTIMGQVAEGLRAAHEGGLTYVGVRPSGISLAADGSAVIQDFSIVRLIGEEQEEDVSHAAPEELQGGATPDSVCDVYSFGAIYYELLTGARVNPFRQGEPARLRTSVPECPEALESLVHRAFEQNRERRFQTFDDVLDELAPLVCELKRGRAAALLVDARHLLASGQIEQAQGLVRDMLELDPANRKARQLHASLRAEHQRRVVADRLRVLFQEAGEAAAARHFARAVELLNQAVQLEGAPPEASTRLEEMCARLERCQNAAQLLADARQLMVEESLDEASAKAFAARTLDPDLPGTEELLIAIEEAAEHKRREARLKEQLANAHTQIAARAYGEAISILTKLRAEYPQSQAVEICLAQADARSLIAEDRLEDAEIKLVRLTEQYPSDPTFDILLQQVRDTVERNASARRALDEVQWLLDQDRPHLAAKFLRGKVAELPQQPELQARLESIDRLIPEWESRRYVQDCLHRATAMEIAENWLAALTLVEQALETSPESPQLLETADRLRSRKREDEMRKKLSRRIEAIQQKLGAGAWTEALSLIGSAQEEFPEDPALQELDEQARTGRRRAECDAVAADVGQYLAAGEPEKAEQVLRRAGNDASLDELWHEVEAGKQYREQCREAQSLLSRRKFREAEQLLASIAGERNLEARVLLESVRTARSASEEGDFYDQARERALRLIMEHEYTQAADLVRNLLNLFPGDPVLERDLERAEEGMLDEQKAAEPLPELPPIEFEPPLPPPPAAAFAMPPVTPAPRAEVPPPAPQRPREIPPPAPLPMAAPPAPPRPRVETVRPAPSQPVAQEPPRLELLGKRRRIQPYVLWPAIAASILIFLGTSGATIWKFSRREAQAAAPPRTAPVTSPRLEEEISPPVADRALAPAPVPVEKKSQEQTKPRPIVARQSFTPPKPAPVPASAPATLPSPGSEQVSVQQEPPRLPSAPGRIAPPPAAKPAEKSIQRQAQKSAQPSPPALIEPKPVNVAPPATPQLALQRGISGVVRLEATVSSRGNITQVKVLSGDPILAVAAKAAVWKWRYDPGTLNGRPTSMTVPIRITFESRK